MCGETCSWRFKSKWRNVEFSSVAIWCKTNLSVRRLASHGNKPRLGSFSTRGETCGQRFRHRRRRLRMAKQLPDTCRIRPTSWEGPLKLATQNLSQIRRQYERPRYENVDMGTVYVRYCSRCSSPLVISRREFALYQDQAQRTIKQLFNVSQKLITDQNRDSRSVKNWLAFTLMAENIFVEGQSNPSIDRQSLRVLRFSIVSWQNVRIPRGHRRMERENWVDYSQPSISRIGSSWRRANGIRVAKFPRMHNIADSRWNSEDDGRNAMWTWAAVHRSNPFHYNDIVWGSNGHTEVCVANSMNVAQDAKRFPYGHWSFLGPGKENVPVGHIRTSRAENGTMLLNKWCLTSVKSGQPEFRGTSLQNGDFCEAKEVENCPHTSVTILKLLKLFGAQSFPSISSVFAEQSRTSVCRIRFENFWLSCQHGETCCWGGTRNDGFTSRYVNHDKPTSDQWPSAGQSAARIQAKSGVSSRWSSVYPSMLRCRFHIGYLSRTVLYEQRQSGTVKIGLSSFMSRVHFTSRWRIIHPWDTRIGPVSEATITYHQGCYGVGIIIDSLLGDESQFWVMISTRLNKYVAEMPEAKTRKPLRRHNRSLRRRPAAKARPKQTSMPMSSTLRTKIPFTKREWIDVEPGKHDQYSFAVAKKLNRLLRHDLSVPRKEDGAIEFKIFARMFISKFELSPHWSIRPWLSHLQKGGGPEKRFQYCLDPNSSEIHGPSGGNQVDPALQDNVMLPNDVVEYINHHVGSSHDLHSIIQSILIAGGKDVTRGRP